MQELTLKDFLSYRYLSAVQYSPDGKRAAFVVSNANEETNSYEGRLWLYDGALRQMTDLGSERGFLWQDDTHLLFPAVRSTREKKRVEAKEQFTAYYSLSVEGGEALPAFTLPFAAQKLHRLDESHYYALGGIDVRFPDYYKMSDEERAKVAQDDADNEDYEVFDESPFWSNGDGVINGQRTALFLITTEPFSVQRVTDGRFDTVTVTELGDELLYAGASYSARYPLRGTGFYAVNWKTGEKRFLSETKTVYPSQLLTVGERVLFRGTEGLRHGINENEWIYTLDPVSGALTPFCREEYNTYGCVGSDCRLGGGEIRHSKGGSLYHTTTRTDSAVLYRLDPDGSENAVFTKPGSIDCFAMSEAHDTALLVAQYDMKLQELYSLDLGTGALTQLTHFNDAALAKRYVAEPLPLSVESEGWTVGGYVLLPKDYDPAKSYPAVLDIHGGPKTVYGPVFYHEMQLWASMGYFVFFCNPMGSDGGGNDFADIRGHYGETDYKNLMDFTDAVLNAYPQIDRKRVCVTGGSYGGFMTNWIIGHTDRFCCAASQRSISNWLSFYGVSDIGPAFAADQCDAEPFASAEKMWAHSPMKYAMNVKTPTLFIHSDEDYRCPLAEGLQMYTSLVEHGVEARLCLFHGENHELSRSGKPKHRVRRLTEITDWFEKHAK